MSNPMYVIHNTAANDSSLYFANEYVTDSHGDTLNDITRSKFYMTQKNAETMAKKLNAKYATRGPVHVQHFASTYTDKQFDMIAPSFVAIPVHVSVTKD